MPLEQSKYASLLTSLNQKNIQASLDFTDFNLSEQQILTVLENLLKQNHVHTLLLSGNEVTDKVVIQINKLKFLTALDISNPTGMGISQVAAATLGGSTTIQHLNLIGHDSIGGKNSERTASYFLRNTSLTSLKLSNFDKVSEDKLQAKIYKNKTGKSIAFLMGFHPRLGKDSSINSSFANSTIFDKNTVECIFNLLNGKEPKMKTKKQTGDTPKSKK